MPPLYIMQKNAHYSQKSLTCLPTTMLNVLILFFYLVIEKFITGLLIYFTCFKTGAAHTNILSILPALFAYTTS